MLSTATATRIDRGNKLLAGQSFDRDLLHADSVWPASTSPRRRPTEASESGTDLVLSSRSA